MKVLIEGKFYKNFPHASEVGTVGALNSLGYTPDILEIASNTYNGEKVSDYKDVLRQDNWDLIISEGLGTKDIGLAKNAFKAMWFKENILLREYQERIARTGPLYDHIFSIAAYTLDILDKCSGHTRSSWLPTGIDQTRFVPVSTNTTFDIVFIGSTAGKHSNRLEIIEHLKKLGFDVHVMQSYDIQEQCKIYSSAKLVLNMGMREPGKGLFAPSYYNQRTFEAISCGACVLSTPICDPHILRDREHIVYFDKNTSQQEIEYILDGAYDNIGLAALEHCSENFSYKNRMEKIISYV